MGEVVGQLSVGAGATGTPKESCFYPSGFLVVRQNQQTKYVFVE
jgi:hypothetical protein